MKAPAYYLIARIDLTGGSSSYHRAALIQAAIEHFSEWWRTGTDYTRHWLPYGVPWSEDHVDITNHYLGQGVKGGLPLMLLFISLLWCGFRYVGQAMQNLRGRDPEREFFAWAVGAGLFAHAASCVSVAYFDQSILFLYLTLALTAALKVNWGWAPASACRAERAASYDLPAVTPTDPALPGAGASGWVPASSGPHEKPGI
jgi:hypothetical protein